ncbi:MAG: hypothetical protein FWG80_02020 [Alphaproteobacteria bacterium]|nr:hypothetical protein [Alphaproteobacteria bacterium]
MNRAAKIFTVLLAVLPLGVYGDAPVIASQYYVDTAIATRASAAGLADVIVNAINDDTKILRREQNNTIVLQNVVEPSNASDAATKGYVDSIVAGLGNVQSDWNAVSGAAQILNKPNVPTITLNNTATNAVVMYAPTAGGTAGHVLQATGPTSAPSWVPFPTVPLATGVSGTLLIGNGGTGGTNQTEAFNNIVASGGTVTGVLNVPTPALP